MKKSIVLVFIWVFGIIAMEANAAPINLLANFHLYGEVNRFSFLGFGDMTVNFGVNSSGNAVSGTEIGRMEYDFNPDGSVKILTTGVLAPISLPKYGWTVVDLNFSVPFTVDDTKNASMFIGLGTNYTGTLSGASGSKQVAFDFSDDITYKTSLIKNTLDQGLSLTSVTLSDGSSLSDAGYKFEFIPESTILSACASAYDDRGVSSSIDTKPGTALKAGVFPFGGTATSKLFGGTNGDVPTQALVNLDVNPEPNPMVFDLACSSVGGAGNIRLSKTAPLPTPLPPAILLFGSSLVGLAGIRFKKKALNQ